MNPISILGVLPKILFAVLFIGLSAGMVFPVYADIALDESNLVGNNGRPYWLINTPGSYYLGFDGDTFYTTNYFAIRIQCSNVTLDGRGKTITGTGPPPDDKGYDDICGVLVNSGLRTENVHIKNLNVEKKYHGILFEWIYNGKVEYCNTGGNHHGITLWNSELMTLDRNTANYNVYGIVLDANLCVNKSNTISNNTASKNDLVGIILHLENLNNELIGNTVNENGHFGISLPKNSYSNILSGNTADGNNSCGIHIQYSDNNTIKDNTMSNNRERGIWLLSANNNIIYNNYFNNSDENVTFSGSNTGNQWNIGRTEDANIVGGPYLGGNFWANPEGTGFSQVTGDSNKDGICDSAYTISSGNVDQLPLHSYTVFEGVIYVNSSDATCGGHFPCYGTIQAAVNAPYAAHTLKIAKGSYNETIVLNETRDITVEGGWNASFTEQTPNTTIINSPKVNSGAMTFRNLVIRP